MWVYFQHPGTWPFWVGTDTFTQGDFLTHPVLGNTCQTSLYLKQTCKILVFVVSFTGKFTCLIMELSAMGWGGNS